MHVALVRHIVATRPRRRAMELALALGLAAALVAGTAHADRWTPVDRTSRVEQGPIAVAVTVGGQRTPLYQRADRADRWYLEAEAGENYQVKVRNLTGERIGFVLSVDGLNAINGLRSHQGADEPMYVLDPWQETTVKGWRKSMSNVSKFVFVDEERSYAARTDQANGDLGWIRVSAFREDRPQVRGWGDHWMGFRDNGSGVPAPSPAPSTGTRGSTKGQYRGDSNGMGLMGQGESTRDLSALDGSDQPASPGTGWGANQKDRVREVDFRAQRFAATQVILRYEYRDALERLGVLPWHDRGRDRLWEREDGELGFAQPPRH